MNQRPTDLLVSTLRIIITIIVIAESPVKCKCMDVDGEMTMIPFNTPLVLNWG